MEGAEVELRAFVIPKPNPTDYSSNKATSPIILNC